MEENQPISALPPTSDQIAEGGPEKEQQSKSGMIGLIIVAVVVLIGLIVGAVFLLRADNATTGRVRDVFIIFMALESIVLGVVMIILIIQLATLINLLQNEIKPIIQSTNETVNTLKGTAVFLSENLTEPVIRLNAFLAGFKQFTDMMRPRRSKR
jgi:uncharacterized membrane protein YjgN (DUF898 family)